MGHEERAFDLAGFLKLLGEVMPQDGTGVLARESMSATVCRGPCPSSSTTRKRRPHN